MNTGIIHIKETDSTNNYLKELLSGQDLKEGTVVFAGYQTAGKGQRGNSWESEESKNLLFSIVLYPQTIKANEQFIISQVVSLGVVDFLGMYIDDILIKWPNDIYWKDRKICGILIENSLQEDAIRESICGIGININQEIFTSDAPNPVSLTQVTGCHYSMEEIRTEVLNKIMFRYAQMSMGELSQIREEYIEHLYRRDGYYMYNDGSKDFYARIKDIEPTGILVLETKEEQERRFAFKEVKYIL